MEGIVRRVCLSAKLYWGPIAVKGNSGRANQQLAKRTLTESHQQLHEYDATQQTIDNNVPEPLSSTE